MSRHRPKRRQRRSAQAVRHANAELALFAGKCVAAAFDALFGPPRPPRFGGFPALEPEPQPATYRVIEPKALPAPQEA